MKNSIGELSLVVVTLVAVSIMAVVVNNMISLGSDYILYQFHILGSDEETILSSDSVNIVNSVVDNDNNVLLNSYDKLVSSLNDNKLNNIIIDNNKKNMLLKKTSKYISNIDKCDYFESKDGYLVSVSDKSGFTYLATFETKMGFFGNDIYKLSSVVETTEGTKYEESMTKMVLENETNDSLYIDSDYDDSYISMALVKNTLKDNDELISKIYDANSSSIVLLNTYNKDNIVNSATGFFIKKGLILTSWDYVNDSILNDGQIMALAFSGDAYNVLGVVSINEELGMAILKIDEEFGDEVTIGDISDGDEVLLLGTFNGIGTGAKVGVNVYNDKLQTNYLYVTGENVGSPLFNSNGLCVGMVLGESTDNIYSQSISLRVLKKYLKMYDGVNFNSIKYTSFSDIHDKYYSYKISNESKLDNISKNVWKDYKDIGNIDKAIKVDPIKRIIVDNKISIRYINDTSIDNDAIVADFISNLKKDNYHEVLNTNKKKVYKGKYTVNIYYDFNYIIVVIEV